jgi:hypothetical protein
MPKGYDGFKPHKKKYTHMSMTAVAKLLLFEEFSLGHGNYSNPRLATLSQSVGDGIGSLAAGGPSASRQRFAEQDVAVLRGLLAPYEARVLRSHYRELLATDEFLVSDHDPFVKTCTSDRVGYFVNQRVKPVIEMLAGQRLQISYSYLVKYYGLAGNTGLRPHTDQVDNEFTVTIAVDWEPEPSGPVPIFFSRERQPVFEDGMWQKLPPAEQAVKVVLGRGDAMLFRGRRHTHWRPPYPLGENSTNLLVHFVKADYPAHLTRGQHNDKYRALAREQRLAKLAASKGKGPTAAAAPASASARRLLGVRGAGDGGAAGASGGSGGGRGREGGDAVHGGDPRAGSPAPAPGPFPRDVPFAEEAGYG